MSIKYQLIQRGNPGKPEDPKKFYASAQNDGDVSLRRLSKEIAEISTVSTPDTMAVIESLLQLIPRHLADGRIVRLGDFGSFGVRLKSGGAESAETFSSSLIEGAKLYFRPGRELNRAMNDLSYQKLPE